MQQVRWFCNLLCEWSFKKIYESKCTYNQTNGVANNKESKRSKNPPCPGSKLPLSFTLANRFNLLSNKSPKVPATADMKAIIKTLRSIFLAKR